MVRDLVGNEIKVDDLLLFSNMKLKVIRIKEGGLLEAKSPIIGGRTQGQMVPGEIKCECLISFDPTKLVGVYVLKQPSNQELAQIAGEGSQA